MKVRGWIAGTSVCFAVGCAGTQPLAVPNAPASEAARTAATEPREPSAAVQASGTRHQRENVPASALATSEFDARFAVTRQVTALERAIELYRMFIERAGDDPRYAEAVARSRGRIDDARVTICFLLEKPCDESD